MFYFLNFDGALSSKHQVYSAAGKTEQKEEMAEGSGTVFWLLSCHPCIDVSACLQWHSSTLRKQWKDKIEKRLLRIEAPNNHSFKLPYKNYLRSFYFEMIHKGFIIFKAIEKDSCSIWVPQANRKLVKVADGKLLRVARTKADENFGGTVQNWLDRKFMHELQHEVICLRKSFTCIIDGLWGEHCRLEARSWSWFRWLFESRSVLCGCLKDKSGTRSEMGRSGELIRKHSFTTV